MKYYDHFIEKLETLMTDEDYKFLKGKVYHDKKDYISLKIGDILAGEKRDFIQDVALNREDYLVTTCCQWKKLYPELTPEQKIIVLVNVYNIYRLNEDGKSRTYESTKSFLKILDEGRISEYKVSAVGHISDYTRDLPGLSPSDVLFWLQHEWHDLSGDWFEKIRNKDYVSRNTVRFTIRNYQAFNEIFKQCFDRELKCIDRFRDKTMIDEFKEAIGG